MDWITLENEVDNLFRRIDYKPDIVIGIARGGVVPALLLASRLHVCSGDVYFLTVKKNGQERMVRTEITENISGKNILLVEDMLESGKSLEAAKAYLENKGARVKTACLYTSTTTSVIPDFYIKVERIPVKFPWE